MQFADIHIHALYGCDDGPETPEEMYRMVDLAYRTGTRVLCLTPHYHPGYFGENGKAVRDAYQKLEAYVGEKYTDLVLYLGNELRFSRSCESWLESGACLTLNGTRNVLVDFSANAPEGEISRGVHRLINAGYIPVLAHVERYRGLEGDIARISSLRRDGVRIQMDAGAIMGEFGLRQSLWAKRLLSAGIVDLVCSDGHDLTRRKPCMDQAYSYLAKKYGIPAAEALCCRNAVKCLK